MARRHLSPSTVLAGAALFFALGGSALAVKEANQPRCAAGAVRGVATVTGGPSGIAAVTSNYSSQGALFTRKFNCSGGQVSVRRVDTGVYDIRFAGNGAATAIGDGLVDGRSVAVIRNADGSFRVSIRAFVSPGNETTFGRMDSAFTIVLL